MFPYSAQCLVRQWIRVHVYKNSFDFPLFISPMKSLVSLKRTWDQKLYSGLMIAHVLNTYFFQFHFADTVHYRSPSWLWLCVESAASPSSTGGRGLWFTLPSTTFHRHPHCYTCVTQHAPNTGTPTYARKSWGGLPRCDLAPQSTSFGTVALRERQHLAMTATCPEGEAWAASRNWNHGTHFLWDPRAAPTFHPLSTQRHRVQHSAFHFPSPQR